MVPNFFKDGVVVVRKVLELIEARTLTALTDLEGLIAAKFLLIKLDDFGSFSASESAESGDIFRPNSTLEVSRYLMPKGLRSLALDPDPESLTSVVNSEVSAKHRRESVSNYWW